MKLKQAVPTRSCLPPPLFPLRSLPEAALNEYNYYLDTQRLRIQVCVCGGGV